MHIHMQIDVMSEHILNYTLVAVLTANLPQIQEILR